MSIEASFQQLPTIETDRLILRQIQNTDKDGADCLEFINDYNVYRYWGIYDESNDPDGEHRPKKHHKLDYHYKYTLKEFKAKREMTWVIELKETNKVIGEFLLYDFQLNKQADIGYRLNKEYWGKGITFEAGQAVTDFAFKNLNLARLQIRCFTSNIGSVSVAKKLNFRQEGLIKGGAIINVMTDYYIFGLLKEDYLNS